MPSRHPYILAADTAVLLLIDMQEPFLRSVEERGRVVERCRFLAESCAILGVRTVATAQYMRRMGPIVPEITAVCPSASDPVDKMCFSCAGSEAFLEMLRASGCRQVLIGGVETHICVAQTALDLLHHGYEVHVAADAVSARGTDRHKLGMEKIRDAGVIPCCAEQAVFEMLAESGGPQFKRILDLVKS